MQLLEEKAVLKCEPFRPRFAAAIDLEGTTELSLCSWRDFQLLWKILPAPEELLSYLYDKFCTFGYVGLQHTDGFIENAQGRQLLGGCLEGEVETWSSQALALASTFWLFESAGILLTEYNQRLLAVGAVEEFLREKRTRYRTLNGAVAENDRAGSCALSLCQEIRALRMAIPAYYIRCFSINGATWEREERFLDSRKFETGIYPVVLAEIERHLGFALPAGPTAQARFEALVDLAAARSVNPFEILVAIANAALRDQELDAEYAVITAPQGRGLDTPWDIKIQDVCSYATLRPDFDPVAAGIEFQSHQIIRAIERRMRHNTSCRSKNYHPSREIRRQAQPFQFPDIAIHESSHHVGHIKASINNSARTHFEIRIPSLAHLGEFRGFGDLRINRVDDSEARRFTFDDLMRLIPYGEWCKNVFDYAIASGLFMDARYCTTA